MGLKRLAEVLGLEVEELRALILGAFKEVANEGKDSRAFEVIEHLNRVSGKNFRVKTYEKLIHSALKTYSVEDLKRVIDVKAQDPYFQENPKYLRPTTLFGSERKIDQYLNEGEPLNAAQVRLRQNLKIMAAAFGGDDEPGRSSQNQITDGSRSPLPN